MTMTRKWGRIPSCSIYSENIYKYGVCSGKHRFNSKMHENAKEKIIHFCTCIRVLLAQAFIGRNYVMAKDNGFVLKKC